MVRKRVRGLSVTPGERLCGPFGWYLESGFSLSHFFSVTWVNNISPKLKDALETNLRQNHSVILYLLCNTEKYARHLPRGYISILCMDIPEKHFLLLTLTAS